MPLQEIHFTGTCL